MALQECGLNLNRVRKELQPHGTLDFPCAGYSMHQTDGKEAVIPWHWHEEMEILSIEAGRLELKLPSRSFYLEQGDCFALNANILHFGAAGGGCKLHSLVFSPTLIIGNEDSVFAKKYLLPLLSCPSFSGYPIRGADGETVLGWFRSAFGALERDAFGFEFIVREKLSRICLFLHGQFEGKLDLKSTALNQDNLRVQKMLAHILTNFAADISLKDIAKAADIGERECLRCFQRTIQLSPMQYLLKYRVMQGAELILEQPACSISEIATLCGFDSPSNFSKLFKRFYNCTPREYRGKHTQ